MKLAGLVFDRVAALHRLEGDEQLLVEMAGLFVQTCPRLLDDIRAAVDRADAQEFGRATNTLKGSLSCLDALAASKAISNLEKIGTHGATAKQALQELEREVARLTAALAELAAVPSRSEKGCLAGA